MKRIYVDFNAREVNGEKQSVLVSPPYDPTDGAAEDLPEGSRVIVYDEETQCEAVLRRSHAFPWIADRVWVADLVTETIQHQLQAAGEQHRRHGAAR